MTEWQPIETAPRGARVAVCGWQWGPGRRTGWWWRGDTVIDENGAPIDRNYKEALYWVIVDFPPYPDAPK